MYNSVKMLTIKKGMEPSPYLSFVFILNYLLP